MEIPIFPLNGAVLYPGTNLPLNIFEDRYIEMIDYSLSKDRQIGMIQTNENNDLFDIGCVGKINSFNETEDGRYLISLQGKKRFRYLKELDPGKSFRILNVEIIEDTNTNTIFSENQKSELLNKYKNYIKIKNLNLNLDEIEKIEFSQLVKFMAMISPFNDIDKQVLLESRNMNEFYDRLYSIIELETSGGIVHRTIN